MFRFPTRSSVEVPSPARAGFLLAVALSAGAAVTGCGPHGRIADSSKTAACSQELTQALTTFAHNHGLAYKVSDQDAKTIFATGRVKKTYARDGVEHGDVFGVSKSSSGCALEFFERTVSEPGRTTSTTADYGSISLGKCRCK